MTNIVNNAEKANSRKLLKIPEIKYLLRGDSVYIRLVIRGKDTKIALNIRLKKGFSINQTTGEVEGDPETTSTIQILTDRARL